MLIIIIYIQAATRQNKQDDLCALRRLRSAWAAAQSDQKLCYVLNEYLSTKCFYMWTEDSNQTEWMPRLI